MYKIVKMIMERNFQPVIIFSFSKKECEAYALQVSKLDFNTGITGELVFLSARVHTHTHGYTGSPRAAVLHQFHFSLLSNGKKFVRFVLFLAINKHQ